SRYSQGFGRILVEYAFSHARALSQRLGLNPRWAMMYYTVGPLEETDVGEPHEKFFTKMGFINSKAVSDPEGDAGKLLSQYPEGWPMNGRGHWFKKLETFNAPVEETNASVLLAEEWAGGLEKEDRSSDQAVSRFEYYGLRDEVNLREQVPEPNPLYVGEENIIVSRGIDGRRFLFTENILSCMGLAFRAHAGGEVWYGLGHIGYATEARLNRFIRKLELLKERVLHPSRIGPVRDLEIVVYFSRDYSEKRNQAVELFLADLMASYPSVMVKNVAGQGTGIPVYMVIRQGDWTVGYGHRGVSEKVLAGWEAKKESIHVLSVFPEAFRKWNLPGATPAEALTMAAGSVAVEDPIHTVNAAVLGNMTGYAQKYFDRALPVKNQQDGYPLSFGVMFGRLMAVLALPLALAGIAFLAPLVKISSPGPVFLAQPRAGYQGRIFNVWKLRTFTDMRYSRHFKRTWLGAVLRPTGLDELPQLFSIIRGDMQWFGPRPQLPGIIDESYVEEILTQTLPGYFSAVGLDRRKNRWDTISLEERKRLELEQIDRRSLIANTRLLTGLIIYTVPFMILGRRPYQNANVPAGAAVNSSVLNGDTVERLIAHLTADPSQGRMDYISTMSEGVFWSLDPVDGYSDLRSVSLDLGPSGRVLIRTNRTEGGLYLNASSEQEQRLKEIFIARAELERTRQQKVSRFVDLISGFDRARRESMAPAGRVISAVLSQGPVENDAERKDKEGPGFNVNRRGFLKSLAVLCGGLAVNGGGAVGVIAQVTKARLPSQIASLVGYYLNSGHASIVNEVQSRLALLKDIMFSTRQAPVFTHADKVQSIDAQVFYMLLHVFNCSKKEADASALPDQDQVRSLKEFFASSNEDEFREHVKAFAQHRPIIDWYIRRSNLSLEPEELMTERGTAHFIVMQDAYNHISSQLDQEGYILQNLEGISSELERFARSWGTRTLLQGLRDPKSLIFNRGFVLRKQIYDIDMRTLGMDPESPKAKELRERRKALQEQLDLDDRMYAPDDAEDMVFDQFALMRWDDDGGAVVAERGETNAAVLGSGNSSSGQRRQEFPAIAYEYLAPQVTMRKNVESGWYDVHSVKPGPKGIDHLSRAEVVYLEKRVSQMMRQYLPNAPPVIIIQPLRSCVSSITDEGLQLHWQLLSQDDRFVQGVLQYHERFHLKPFFYDDPQAFIKTLEELSRPHNRAIVEAMVHVFKNSQASEIVLKPARILNAFEAILDGESIHEVIEAMARTGGFHGEEVCGDAEDFDWSGVEWTTLSPGFGHAQEAMEARAADQRRVFLEEVQKEIELLQGQKRAAPRKVLALLRLVAAVVGLHQELHKAIANMDTLGIVFSGASDALKAEALSVIARAREYAFVPRLIILEVYDEVLEEEIQCADAARMTRLLNTKSQARKEAKDLREEMRARMTQAVIDFVRVAVRGMNLKVNKSFFRALEVFEMYLGKGHSIGYFQYDDEALEGLFKKTAQMFALPAVLRLVIETAATLRPVSEGVYYRLFPDLILDEQEAWRLFGESSRSSGDTNSAVLSAAQDVELKLFMHLRPRTVVAALASLVDRHMGIQLSFRNGARKNFTVIEKQGSLETLGKCLNKRVTLRARGLDHEITGADLNEAITMAAEWLSSDHFDPDFHRDDGVLKAEFEYYQRLLREKAVRFNGRRGLHFSEDMYVTDPILGNALPVMASLASGLEQEFGLETFIEDRVDLRRVTLRKIDSNGYRRVFLRRNSRQRILYNAPLGLRYRPDLLAIHECVQAFVFHAQDHFGKDLVEKAADFWARNDQGEGSSVQPALRKVVERLSQQGNAAVLAAGESGDWMLSRRQMLKGLVLAGMALPFMTSRAYADEPTVEEVLTELLSTQTAHGLIKSFKGTSDTYMQNQAVTYDQAVAGIAALAAGRTVEAVRIFNFFYNQHNGGDPAWNGFVNMYDAVRGVKGNELTIHVGPNVWMGMFCLHLYMATRDARAITLAQALLNWAMGLNHRDGAVALGPVPNNNIYSTEHNLDYFVFLKGIQPLLSEAQAALVQAEMDGVATWLSTRAYDRARMLFKRGAYENPVVYATDTSSFALLLGSQVLENWNIVRPTFISRSETAYRVGTRGFDVASAENANWVPRARYVFREFTLQM
ncbi:MAG TPA: sugar transferase, partial [Candidatus Omnitrophota bacterium]|nr:sugar transferase [Candidatus Omnitrophota bacterium]